MKSSKSSESFHTHSTTSGSSSSANVRRTAESFLPLNIANLKRLVGRSDEIATMKNAYQRLRELDAPSEIVLVRGESGTGKTALVNTLENVADEFFVSGKFQDNSRAYEAIVEAMTQLCYLIQKSDKFSAIRTTLYETLSEDECQTLYNVVPSIGFVVRINSDTEQAANFPTSEHAFHRISVLVRSFLAAICKHSTIVLFLDDLQWADESSRQIISSLTSDAASKNLLLVGALRTEAKAEEFYSLNSVLCVSIITLDCLDENSVNEMVAAVTDQRPENTIDLGKIVFCKTNGNPYFVVQYLETLHRDGLLGYSIISSRWEWNIDAIASKTNVSDNVVEMLIYKISSQPEATQVALMIAATIAFTFTSQRLEKILTSKEFLEVLSYIPKYANVKYRKLSDAELIKSDGENIDICTIENVLAQAVEVGLLERLSDVGAYKFSHNRVQEAALSLQPDGAIGKKLQVRLGEIILRMSRSDVSEEDMLFTAVDLLTKHSDLTSLNGEGLAELCLSTARMAQRRNAFISASKYAENGLANLDSHHRWKDSYKLTLDLCKLSAEMHYSYGNFDPSMVRVAEILSNVVTLNDKIRAYCIRVFIMGARNDLTGAIQEGRSVLKLLGVRLPRKANTFHIMRKVARIKRLLEGRKAADLLDFPPLTDNSRVDEAMRLLSELSIYQWRSGDMNTVIVGCLTLTQLTLENGMGRYGPMSMATYGACLAHAGEFDQAYEYGCVALELTARPEMKESYPHTMKVVHLVLNHLKRPAHESLTPMLKAYQVGKEIGHVAIAAYALQAHCMIGVIVGMTLGNLEIQFRSCCDFCREFQQKSILMEILPFHQLTLNLMGESKDPLVLSGSEMVEKDFLNEIDASEEGLAALLLLTYARVILLYIYGDWEKAEVERQKMDARTDFISSYFMKYFNYFFCGMNCLGLARKKHARKFRRHARFYINGLRRTANAGSMNCVPMLTLMEAEDRALGDTTGVLSKDYDLAISMSARCGFRLVKAIACERAGEYMSKCGDKSAAKTYLEQARAAYGDHGAYGKVEDMEKKYEGVITFDALAKQPRTTVSALLQPHIVESWETCL